MRVTDEINKHDWKHKKFHHLIKELIFEGYINQLIWLIIYILDRLQLALCFGFGVVGQGFELQQEHDLSIDENTWFYLCLRLSSCQLVPVVKVTNFLFLVHLLLVPSPALSQTWYMSVKKELSYSQDEGNLNCSCGFREEPVADIEGHAPYRVSRLAYHPSGRFLATCW